MLEDPRSLAFLDGPIFVGDLKLRPISIMTAVLAEHFGLSLVLSGGDLTGLDQEELDGQLSVFIWMQSEKPEEVLQDARSGEWEAYRKVRFSEDLSLASIIIAELRRHHDILKSARFRVVGDKKESTLWHPCWAARMVHIAPRWSESFVLWHLPLTRVELYDHCAVRSLGWKTAKPLAPGETTPASEQLAKLEHAATEQPAASDDW